MLDKDGNELRVGDRVRWNSMGNEVLGTIRGIYPCDMRHVANHWVCTCDNGDPTNPDLKTNGWTQITSLSGWQVTRITPLLDPAEVEARERAELARLQKTYPDAGDIDDPGCSEAGNWFSDYGMGQCPIRRAPCVVACLRRTVANMKQGLDSHALQSEVRYQMGRNDGIDEAAALCKRVGSRSVASAIAALRTASPGAAAAKALDAASPRKAPPGGA